MTACTYRYRERDDEDASERIGVSSWTADVLEEYLSGHTQSESELELEK